MCNWHRAWFWTGCGSISVFLGLPLGAAEQEMPGGSGRVDDVVLVTGSAIRRQEATTTAPITIIDRAALEGSGLVSVGDVLQDLPAQSNAINIQYNNGGDGSTRVDVRGVGSRHTLVLLDGRRLVSGGTGADTAVDLNAIPLALVSRIEVLKDGASAIYGSDAVGGVVNIITRADHRGASGDVYFGASGENDGATRDLSFVYGAGGDSGSFFLGGSFTRIDEIWAGDRDYSAVPEQFDFQAREPFYAGSSGLPNGLLFRDEFEESFDPGNAFYQSDVAANCPLPPETPENMGFRSALCTRDAPESPWRELIFPDETYNYQPDNYLVTPSERTSVFGSGHRRLGSSVRLSGHLLYTTRESAQHLAPTPLFSAAFISTDSIYNPYGKDIFSYNRRLVEANPRVFTQDVDTLQLSAGLDGEIAGDFARAHDWTWEVAVNYGESSAAQIETGNIMLSRLNDGTGPSFVDENGVPRCGVQGPLPGAEDDETIRGCIPVDLLGPAGSITPQMMSYLAYQGSASGSTTEESVLGRLSGRLFETPWNGHLSAAVGAEYRKQSGEFTPDPITQAGDTSGNTALALGGSYDATEEFVELSFVPVTERAWARSLEFNGAARAYRYSSFVEGVAWRAGALWRTAGGITLRGNYSRDYSTPTVGELFSPGFDSFGGGQDPCDATFGSLDDPNVAARCTAEGLAPTFESEFAFFVPTLFGAGNPALREETSTTRTFGVVFEPSWLEGFALSVDYFDLAIEDETDFLSSFSVLDRCYFAADAERENCDDVVRDPATGFISFVNLEFENISATRTSGYDIALGYAHDFGAAGRFSFSIEATYLDDYEEEVDGFVTEGVGVYDLELVLPRLKTQSTVRWDRGALGFGANLRSIGDFIECENNFCAAFRETARKVSANYTADVFASYRLQNSFGATTLRAGVNNVLDEPPAVIYWGFLAESDASEYDYAGRFFYAGLTQSF